MTRLSPATFLQLFLFALAAIGATLSPAFAVFIQIPMGIAQLFIASYQTIGYRRHFRVAQSRLKIYWTTVAAWIVGLLLFQGNTMQGFGMVWLFVVPWGIALYFLTHSILLEYRPARKRSKFLPNLEF